MEQSQLIRISHFLSLWNFIREVHRNHQIIKEYEVPDNMKHFLYTLYSQLFLSLFVTLQKLLKTNNDNRKTHSTHLRTIP